MAVLTHGKKSLGSDFLGAVKNSRMAATQPLSWYRRRRLVQIFGTDDPNQDQIDDVLAKLGQRLAHANSQQIAYRTSVITEMQRSLTAVRRADAQLSDACKIARWFGFQVSESLSDLLGSLNYKKIRPIDDPWR